MLCNKSQDQLKWRMATLTKRDKKAAAAAAPAQESRPAKASRTAEDANSSSEDEDCNLKKITAKSEHEDADAKKRGYKSARDYRRAMFEPLPPLQQVSS